MSAALTEDVLIRRLAEVGHGNAADGFRALCTKAQICSVCCKRWDDAGDCPCTTGAKAGAR